LTRHYLHLINSLPPATAHRDIHSFPTRRSSDLAKASPDPEQSISRVNIEEVTRNVLEALRNEIEKNGVEIITSFKTSEILFPKKIGRAPSELQSRENLVCRLLLEKKKTKKKT